MTEPEPVPVDLAGGEAVLGAATAQLRTITSPRAVEVADRILAVTLATPRPSRPVRARAPHDRLRVSTLAIIATMRRHIDTNLAEAAVGRILLDVDDGTDELRGITVELYARYGTDILATADRARELARAAVDETLGAAPPSTPESLVVLLGHIHVSDITVADPHLVDPGDEQPVPHPDPSPSTLY